jgi:PAS domain S-box-containing protein
MEMHRLCSQLEDRESNLHHIFNTSIPICITNIDYEILLANNAYKNIFQTKEHKKAVEKCYESRPGPACQTESCPLQRVQKGEKEVICEPVKTNTDGSKQYFIVTAKPFFSKDGNVLGIIESFQDITERRIVEKERDELIAKLQKNLEEIKTLRGILPICCHCKNIRNDSGYYEQIESYIHRHSDVDFSHTICPSCVKKYYPEEYEAIMLNKK